MASSYIKYLSLVLIQILLTYVTRIAQSDEAEAQGNILVSLIYGFGVPWDVQGGYMTTGYVIRVSYSSPMNVATWKSPYGNYFRTRRDAGLNNSTAIATDSPYVDNRKPVKRSKRAQNSKKKKPKRKSNPNIDKYRWAAYHALEVHAEKLGYSGRSCVLRSICEAAAVPFSWKSGLFGELLHILFTPSSSKDPITKHSLNEYFHAEYLGKSNSPCDRIFKECKRSLLDTFSGILLGNSILK